MHQHQRQLSSEDDDLNTVLNVRDSLRNHQWRLAAAGSLLWVVMVVLICVCTPFVVAGALFEWLRNFSLKLRKRAADKIRPKNVVRARNPEPASDLVAAFCDYELLLLSGKETLHARLDIIYKIAHVEQELEEHRILCAEIRKLRVEDERPRRRDAILSTKLRAASRRDRESREETK